MTLQLLRDDNRTAISSIIQSSIVNGQGYGVTYTQTIGGAAQGNYAISIFNPSTSGKNVLVFSVKVMQNYSNTTGWIYTTSADPAYNTNLSSAIVNMKDGGPASVLGSHVTANSASVAFPSGNAVEMALGNPELVPDDCVYSLTPGNGLSAFVFAANSQEYAIAIKWLEY